MNAMKMKSMTKPSIKRLRHGAWPSTKGSGPWPAGSKPRRRKRRRLTLAVLPTLLTLGNGVCGMASIAVATSALLDWTNEQQLFVAGLLIFAGMVFDALDGSAARMTGQSSEFGAQLDSLCDAITFGAAPAVIVWRFSDILPHRIAWAIGVIFALCVLIRLARFNVETGEDDKHEGFDGLPSPAAAGTIASFTIAMPQVEYLTHESDTAWIRQAAELTLSTCEYLVPVLAVPLAYLMVSRLTYPHVVQQLIRGRRSPNQIGQALFAVGGVIILHELALPLLFCWYAFAPAFKQWRRIFEPADADKLNASPSGTLAAEKSVHDQDA
ncbi:MAG: CDP-diacylglycerol--serine O-phosphatidyltransferase [Planctomycetaceae bacterium]|nr:MAG: CDP-diacylglycerol--serine O-phosphatidyltransferase [Planctomycetaceae bacterium]